MYQSFPAILVDQPFRRGLFAEYPPAILVADPILISHQRLKSVHLSGVAFQLRALLSKILEPVLNGFSAFTVRAVWIHRVESTAFDSQANEPADLSFANNGVAVAFAQV